MRIIEDISIDFETYSRVDLTKVGHHAYAQHPSTGVHCMSYRMPGDTETRRWVEGDHFPLDLELALMDGVHRRAWNLAFEREIWKEVCVKKYNWPSVPDSNGVCTMVEAQTMGLPGALQNAAPAIGSDIIKDDVGKRIMLQLCQPKPSDGKFWTKAEAPEKFDALYRYCDKDVESELSIAERILPLRPDELIAFRNSNLMNDRGVLIDEPFVHAAKKVVVATMERLEREMRELTNYEVAGPSAVMQIKKWATLQIQGTNCTAVIGSLDKEAIEDLLTRDDLPSKVERALIIRQEAAKWGDVVRKAGLRAD